MVPTGCLLEVFSILIGTGFGWERVKLIHRGWWGVVFWISDENGVDTIQMFWLLLSDYTGSGPFLLLRLPYLWVGWECTRIWEGTQPGQWTPGDQRDFPDHMASPSVIKAGGWKFLEGCHYYGAGWASLDWWHAIMFLLCHIFFFSCQFFPTVFQIIKLSLSEHIFSHLYPSDSPSILLWGHEWVTSWYLAFYHA